MIDDGADRDQQAAGASGSSGGHPAGGESLDDLLGAYLLDALTEEERAAFEAHLATSEPARREVARLRPVVDLLPLALDRPLDPAAAEPGPSGALRDRILAAARVEEERAAEVAPEPGPVAPPRPDGDRDRTAPVEPVPIRPPAPARPPVRVFDPGSLRRIPWSGWALAAAVFALLSVGALIWALNLREDLEQTEDDLAGVQQTATAEAAGPGVQALAYIMTPTPDGPETGGGVLFPDPANPATANLNVLGMPALPAGQVYQLWFVELDEQGNPIAARPSVTFGVDDGGNGATEVPLPAEPFDIVAVTREPEGGSQTHTPPILLTGAPGTAAG